MATGAVLKAGASSPFGAWWGSGAVQSLATSQPPIFRCPSDGTQPTDQWAYMFTSGYTLYGGYFESAPFGITNYAACAGYIGNGYPPLCGVFYTDSQNTLVSVTDGTSNTIFFGESLADGPTGTGLANGTVPIRASWMGSFNMPTAWGLSNNAFGWYMFSSRHTGGVINYGFGDGSVRQIMSTADWTNFQYAARPRTGSQLIGVCLANRPAIVGRPKMQFVRFLMFAVFLATIVACSETAPKDASKMPETTSKPGKRRPRQRSPHHRQRSRNSCFRNRTR